MEKLLRYKLYKILKMRNDEKDKVSECKINVLDETMI